MLYVYVQPVNDFNTALYLGRGVDVIVAVSRVRARARVRMIRVRGTSMVAGKPVARRASPARDAAV